MDRKEFLRNLGIPVPKVAVPKVVEGPAAELVRGSLTAFKNIAEKLDVPVGSINSFLGEIGDKAPGGWLLCDGAKVNVREYPALFVAIGQTYGADYGWDGKSEDFQVPNFMGPHKNGSTTPSPGVILSRTFIKAL